MWFNVLLLLSFIIFPSLQFEFRHHDNNDMVQVFEDVNTKCPNITRIYTLSETSVNGLPLYLIEFSTRPGQHEISRKDARSSPIKLEKRSAAEYSYLSCIFSLFIFDMIAISLR
ncbi:hypothetical protein WA026_018717 [Henosepilachna vigintioctopunctata]|uniref:Uncharacterized protein n=1 Tax=Henosepilachna vigintioctopunctata TaxID=420089 RepID=A0AAW1TXL8_9CUCU